MTVHDPWPPTGWMHYLFSWRVNQGIDVNAEVIDRGYQGNIGVVLKNNSKINVW